MSDMPDFTAGFTARHHVAAETLKRVFSLDAAAFSPADIRQRAGGGAGSASFAPQDARPRHFSPADPDKDPTAGWDPFDANATADRPAGATGFVDPVKAAHDMGFEEGRAAGLAEAAEAATRDRALLDDVVRALGEAGQIDRDKMAAQLRQAVLHLVRRIVGEVGVSADLLAQRVTVATELLADSAESALLHVHPDDLPLLEGKLPSSVFAAGDAEVARGGFVLESASTIVEDGPTLWLDQLAQAIDRVAVPRD